MNRAFAVAEYLISWENLDVDRFILRNESTSDETIAHFTKEQQWWLVIVTLML